jgi:hypothetical protein
VIANCQMPIADWLDAEPINWQSTRPTRYRVVVLTSWSRRMNEMRVSHPAAMAQ